jgi:hypothetical protein
MNITSLAGLSGNYLKSALANQLTSNTLTHSSAQTAKNGQPSAFAQMLQEAGVSNAPTGNPSSVNNPSQLFNQLVSNFQASGLRNQGQSLDPMSIGS